MRLSTHLLARILLSGSGVLLATLLWLITSGHRNVQDDLARAAASMERILELQFVGPTQGAGMTPRFPDWYPVTQVPRPDGACIRLFDDSGELLRSACRGIGRDIAPEPEWFAKIYTNVFQPNGVVTRRIDGGKFSATLELEPDPNIEIRAAWHQASQLAVPAALLIGVLCFTVWWSVRRALAPAKIIMNGLSAIEHGALDTRLGPFQWIEFDRIAAACNTLAQSLASSHTARISLSRRLMQVQEEERLGLARDLHDEFGQHLSAIGAHAAALRSSLSDADLIGDARRIEDSAAHLMQLVRDLLLRLRPWTAGEINLSEALYGLGSKRGKHRSNQRSMSNSKAS